MAKAPRGKRLEDAMDRLRAAAEAADDTLLPQVRAALGSGSSHLAKKAADIAKSRDLRGLKEELEAAFTFFLRNPEEDRGCLAKSAIAGLLLEEPDSSDEIWLAAARHVQMEGSYGPPVDAAADLRGLAAIGVAASHLRNKSHVLIDLLLDKETAARAGAIRALGYMGTSEALSLVRYKALLGDGESEVMGECFRALLSDERDREESIPFVTTFLEGDREDWAEEAALALGDSHDARALPPLMEKLSHTAQPSLRATLLRAVALLRREEAYAQLGAWLKEEGPRVRAEARMALEVFRDEAELAFLFA